MNIIDFDVLSEISGALSSISEFQSINGENYDRLKEMEELIAYIEHIISLSFFNRRQDVEDLLSHLRYHVEVMKRSAEKVKYEEAHLKRRMKYLSERIEHEKQAFLGQQIK